MLKQIGIPEKPLPLSANNSQAIRDASNQQSDLTIKASSGFWSLLKSYGPPGLVVILSGIVGWVERLRRKANVETSSTIKGIADFFNEVDDGVKADLKEKLVLNHMGAGVFDSIHKKVHDLRSV